MTKKRSSKEIGRPMSLFKILIISDGVSGATSVRRRITDDTFIVEYMMTIGAEFRVKNIEVEGETVKLQLWDLAGQDRFKQVREIYYLGARGAILVYEVVRPRSLQVLGKFITELEQHLGEGLVPLLILGNKIDCRNEKTGQCLSFNDGVSFAMEVQSRLRARGHDTPVLFGEVSAKTGKNVHELFELFVTIVKRYHRNETLPSDEQLLLASILY